MSATIIKRRPSQRVLVGKVMLGGGAPIVVQSMTNTDTADAEATTQQVFELAKAGSELVRITVNTPEAAAQVARIRSRLDSMGCDVPLVGDFHYNGHRLLTDYPDCAQALAKYRINPGNVGRNRKSGKLLAGHPEDDPFTMMIETAIRYDKPVRIGVNWGSLDQNLVVRMMDENARLAQPKEPGGDRTQEVLVGQEILQTLGMRAFAPMVTACPGCGRTTSSFFQELAQSIQTHLRTQMPLWREQYEGVENMTVAVMGCVVNGPGESKLANIGISLPGTGESPAAPVYIDGVKAMTLRGDNIAREFTEIVDSYVARKYSARKIDATKPPRSISHQPA